MLSGMPVQRRIHGDGKILDDHQMVMLDIDSGIAYKIEI